MRITMSSWYQKMFKKPLRQLHLDYLNSQDFLLEFGTQLNHFNLIYIDDILIASLLTSWYKSQPVKMLIWCFRSFFSWISSISCRHCSFGRQSQRYKRSSKTINYCRTSLISWSIKFLRTFHAADG